MCCKVTKRDPGHPIRHNGPPTFNIMYWFGQITWKKLISGMSDLNILSGALKKSHFLIYISYITFWLLSFLHFTLSYILQEQIYFVFCFCESVCVLTFSQRLPDLVRVSRQVEVGLPGLQVANRTAAPRHTKPLNEQIWGWEEWTAPCNFSFQLIWNINIWAALWLSFSVPSIKASIACVEESKQIRKIHISAASFKFVLELLISNFRRWSGELIGSKDRLRG